MRTLDVARLEEHVAATKAGAPLVVCFVRGQDAPSEALLAAVEAAAAELPRQVDLARVDVDANAAALDALRVFKVPELIVWSDGRIAERTEGSLGADQARQLLAHALDDAARNLAPR